MALLTTAGFSHLEIARALEINVETLQTHFGAELANAPALAAAQNALRLLRAAEKGSTGAMKQIQLIIEQSRAEAETELLGWRDHGNGRRLNTPIGKKEQAALDALCPDTTTTMGALMARRAAMYSTD